MTPSLNRPVDILGEICRNGLIKFRGLLSQTIVDDFQEESTIYQLRVNEDTPIDSTEAIQVRGWNFEIVKIEPTQINSRTKLITLGKSWLGDGFPFELINSKGQSQFNKFLGWKEGPYQTLPPITPKWTLHISVDHLGVTPVTSVQIGAYFLTVADTGWEIRDEEDGVLVSGFTGKVTTLEKRDEEFKLYGGSLTEVTPTFSLDVSDGVRPDLYLGQAWTWSQAIS